MGFQKAKASQTGQSGDYWRIASILMDYKEKRAEIRVELYKSKADKDVGKLPMESYSMTVSGADWTANLRPAILNADGVNPRKQLYPWVKANADALIKFDLSDATNVDPD